MVKPKFYRKLLKNGMTVLLEHRKNSGVVSVAFAVKHGGVHENIERKGLSHFIEHMLYKGTLNRTSKQISEEIEKNGGILNGFTEEELTAYWCKMPSNKIDVALNVLSDMVLHPLFDKTELDKERQVILEEIKMRKDRPDIYVSDKIQNLLYDGNLGLDIAGSENSLRTIDNIKIRRAFEEIYNTNNLFLCVVGDVNFKKLCDFCEKTFSKTSSAILEPSVLLKNGQRIEKRKGIDQANMIFAYHVPRAYEKLSYAGQVLTGLMVGGMSSRLWQEIREKRNLAYAVRGGSNLGKRFGYNYVMIGCSAENLEPVKQLILAEFKKIVLLGQKELDQVKEQLIGNSKISREDSQGQMLDLIYNEVWGDAKRSYDYEKGIRNVKIEDVKKLADFKDYSFMALVPE